MSYPTIRKLLEERLASLVPALDIAYENRNYKPALNTPWQETMLLPARTENPTMGDDFKREVGIFQIMLHYPGNKGPGEAGPRAELIRNYFARGNTYTSGTLRVLIDLSPSIAAGFTDGPWYNIPISIPYIADVY